ncbi:MAG: hypothetical protein VW162_09955, partial [Alphaproteobacteria bacterium]
FLIPMATTITFGLAVTSVLVLFVVPAMIGVSSDIGRIVRVIMRFFGVGWAVRDKVLLASDK